MSEMVSIQASIDLATSTLLRQAADARGITDAEYVAEAVRRMAESDSDFRAFVQVGIDAIERGEVVSHEEVMAELDQMIAEHRGRA